MGNPVRGRLVSQCTVLYKWAVMPEFKLLLIMKVKMGRFD